MTTGKTKTLVALAALAALAGCSETYQERQLVHPVAGASPDLLPYHRASVSIEGAVDSASPAPRLVLGVVTDSPTPAMPSGSTIEFKWSLSAPAVWSPSEPKPDAKVVFCAIRIVRPDGSDLYGGEGAMRCLGTLADLNGHDGIPAEILSGPGRPIHAVVPSGGSAFFVPWTSFAPAPSMDARTTIFPKGRFSEKDHWWKF